jgi:flagellar biosynthesis/type III secretory pathway M-ring protein FliF/YscJ
LIEILLGVVLFALVVAFVLVPLRRERHEGGEEDARVAELESRKEAKYREIRDTELDHAAGKLSDEDFRRQDAELRRDAVKILKQLDQATDEERSQSTSGEAP